LRRTEGLAKETGGEGENPARWRGHLDHLLPQPSKLARGHHAAMPYGELAAFIAKLMDKYAAESLPPFARLLTVRSRYKGC